MEREIHRYKFDSKIAFEDVEASLILALFAAESLHGDAQVRLDASQTVDSEQRECLIDSSTSVGRDINRLFTGFLLREFGPDAFHVEKVRCMAACQPQEVQGGTP